MPLHLEFLFISIRGIHTIFTINLLFLNNFPGFTSFIDYDNYFTILNYIQNYITSIEFVPEVRNPLTVNGASFIFKTKKVRTISFTFFFVSFHFI